MIVVVRLLRCLVMGLGLGFSVAFASDDCDDLTAGLVDGCPLITYKPGSENSPTSETAFFRFYNNCRHSVRLAVTYLDVNGNWKTRGWFNFPPGEEAYLSANDGGRLESNNAAWYYYAECINRSCSWSGSHRMRLRDTLLPMTLREDADRRGDNSWGIKCVRW